MFRNLFSGMEPPADRCLIKQRLRVRPDLGQPQTIGYPFAFRAELFEGFAPRGRSRLVNENAGLIPCSSTHLMWRVRFPNRLDSSS